MMIHFLRSALPIVLTAVALLSQSAWAANNCVSRMSGNWKTSNTWTNCGRTFPQDGDTATIQSGHTVTLDESSKQLAGMTINSGGVLKAKSGNNLYIRGTLLNNGTFDMRGSSSENTIYLVGNLVLSGSSSSIWYADKINYNGNSYSLTFASGAAFTLNLQSSSSNGVIQSMGGSATFNGGNSPNSSVTIALSRSGSQTLPAATNITYPSISTSGSGTKTVPYNTLNVLGSINVGSGTTLDVSGAPVNLYGNLTVSGTLTTAWQNFSFLGSSTQTLTGGANFYRLVINNAAGVQLSSGDVTVNANGSVTLTAGELVTGTNKLIIPTNCDQVSWSRSAGYVNGNVRLTFPAYNATCTFPVGSGGNYAPITVSVPWFNGIAGGTLTGSTASGEHPNISSSTLSASLDVNRYWTLGVSGDTFTSFPTGGSYNVILQFAASELDSGAASSSLHIEQYTNGWGSPIGSASGIAASATGLKSFGSFAVGAVNYSQSSSCTGTVSSGVINTYYPGVANVSAGGTAITVGSSRPSTGTPIAAGDLVLIMQMQAVSTFDSSNSASYGTASSTAGAYEYAKVQSVSGNVITLTSGLLNSYINADYGTFGQQRFQVIRVPVYVSATLTSGVTASAWNGSTGGVLAFDVVGNLALNGASADVSGKGFRGGGGRILYGGTGNNDDYVTFSTNTTNASKGEGIAGTPRYVNNLDVLQDNGVEGYPGGSYARGAPGNAGGGGTDANPSSNDQNVGGGGGGNGGAGGYGGYGWSAPSAPGRGIGGHSVAMSAARLTMGGGAGAGSSNNGTNDGAGFNSSGVAGGGIILVRAASLSGTGTFRADGSANTYSIGQDASGGGGAGGAVLVFANSGLNGLTISVAGGQGGSNTATDYHGPGGGGGGGYAITSGSPASCNAAGGSSGTTTGGYSYGATSGSDGSCVSSLATNSIPGGALGTVTCAGALDHVEFVQAGTGINCMALPITVYGCTSSAQCYNNSANRVTTSFTVTPTAISGANWCTDSQCSSPLNTSTGTALSNGQIIYFQDLMARTDRLAATSSGTTAAVQCVNSTTGVMNATTSCDVTFSGTGLMVSTTAGGAEATIPTQIAGATSNTYVLRAVKTNSSTQSCESAVAGIKTVNWAYICNDPTTCVSSGLMSFNSGVETKALAGNPNGNVSSVTPVKMQFDSNGNSNFTFNYADVGMVTLYVSMPASGKLTSPLSGATNAFVVKPSGFSFTTISDANGNNNPAATDANGGVFTSAGTTFSATVTALALTGSATPSFGQETSREGVILSPTLVGPSGGTVGALGGTATITGDKFSSGTATVTDLTYSEVGIMALNAGIADGDYLGGGNATSQSGNIGRFTPHHFAVNPGAITPACTGAPPAIPFSYFGQDGFVTDLTLTAQSTTGATTKNYVGNYAKLAPASYGAYGFSGAFPSTGYAGYVVGQSGASDYPSGTWSNGVLSAKVKHQTNRLTTASVTPLTLGITSLPQDSDGVTTANGQPVSLGNTLLRYGRLHMANAFGSELLDLAVFSQVEYVNDSRIWVKNADDSCTTLSQPTSTSTTADLDSVFPDGTLASYYKTLTANCYGSNTVTRCYSIGKADKGDLNFKLLKPGIGGFVNIQLPVPDYLFVPNMINNTSARATFGIPKTNSRVIYRRESF